MPAGGFPAYQRLIEEIDIMFGLKKERAHLWFVGMRKFYFH